MEELLVSPRKPVLPVFSEDHPGRDISRSSQGSLTCHPTPLLSTVDGQSCGYLEVLL